MIRAWVRLWREDPDGGNHAVIIANLKCSCFFLAIATLFLFLTLIKAAT